MSECIGVICIGNTICGVYGVDSRMQQKIREKMSVAKYIFYTKVNCTFLTELIDKK